MPVLDGYRVLDRSIAMAGPLATMPAAPRREGAGAHPFVSYDHPTEGTVTTPGFAFRMSDTRAAVIRPAPTTGQHTTELLADLGLDQDRIAALAAAGVVRTA